MKILLDGTLERRDRILVAALATIEQAEVQEGLCIPRFGLDRSLE